MEKEELLYVQKQLLKKLETEAKLIYIIGQMDILGTYLYVEQDSNSRK
jgi:hypothetical protein